MILDSHIRDTSKYKNHFEHAQMCVHKSIQHACVTYLKTVFTKRYCFWINAFFSDQVVHCIVSYYFRNGIRISWYFRNIIHIKWYNEHNEHIFIKTTKNVITDQKSYAKSYNTAIDHWDFPKLWEWFEKEIWKIINLRENREYVFMAGSFFNLIYISLYWQKLNPPFSLDTTKVDDLHDL